MDCLPFHGIKEQQLYKSLCLFCLHFLVKRVFPDKKLKEDFHPLRQRDSFENPKVFPRSAPGLKEKQNKTTTKQINKQRIVNFVAWQQAEEMISTNFPLNTTEKKNHGYKGGVGDKEA